MVSSRRKKNSGEERVEYEFLRKQKGSNRTMNKLWETSGVLNIVMAVLLLFEGAFLCERNLLINF